MNRKSFPIGLVALLAFCIATAVRAQTVSEDFTGANTNNSWWFFNGACLTAGSTPGAEPSGTSFQMPGCVAIGQGGSGPLYYNEPLVGGYNGVSGSTQTLPDPTGNGALRFTNGNPGGFDQNGAIVSTTPFPTGQGVSITFKTVTYRGNSGGGDSDGADGMSFYLMDASQLNTAEITGTSSGNGNGIGSWGGSLGFTCSNTNAPYNGIIGGYLAVGIDEYGNFLNGENLMSGYTGSNTASGDNTAEGYGYKPNRIGLRGAGSIAYTWLNANYPTYYPSGESTSYQENAVMNTCKTGEVWNSTTGKAATISGKTVSLYDYAPIPGAYVELPYTQKIANESAMSRGAAQPIFYQLSVTGNGLLSLSYSYNGGAYQSVISGQNITTSNGPLPANFLFGFAGSTGGSSNIHEILCFKAAPATTSASSAGASEKQSAQLETGAQAYFAYYNPNNWTGDVTASNLTVSQSGAVTIATTPNWDAACTLTGVPTGETCLATGGGPTAALAPTSRAILTWNGTTGIPFEWNNLTSAQQTALDAGDSTALASESGYEPYSRLNFLRGNRTQEINSAGVGLFRTRTDVLADVIDSSPAWVGPPDSPYTAPWTDRLYPSATAAESATTAQTYAQYVTASGTRLNVVYVGSNDGLLHGFRSGSYDGNGNFINNATTPNDGMEVLAYMPSAVVQSIHSTTATGDYSNPQYAHAFFVDATPATGDLFYAGQWHTWVAGGLGAGGADFFALDVTNPTSSNFVESNAGTLVIGDWTPSTITCTNVGNCGNNMGNSYGTPQIRRMHNGDWAVIWGNGFGSASGDAGIYIMTIDANTAAQTFYYLSTSTGSASNPNGIAFPSAADLDGDHITDYIYAGDLQGNLWRFDVTSSNPANWAVTTPGPLFTAPAGQPITTAIAIAGGAPTPGMEPFVMLLFGTGQKTPLSATSPATYATAQQSLYGVWDWNMTAWDAASAAQYQPLAPGSAPSLTGPNYTISQSNLTQQVVAIGSSGDVDITTNATVCWAGLTTCTSGNNKYGWYLNFPSAQEQVIYSPQLVAQALTVNTIVPANNSPTSCTNNADTGYTYLLSALTGAAFSQVFLPASATSTYSANPQYADSNAIAMLTGATGTSFVIYNAAGTPYLVFETAGSAGQAGTSGGSVGSGSTNGVGDAFAGGGTLGANLPPNNTGKRISWIERR
jgi:type IV pilus assembly protein PilY1